MNTDRLPYMLTFASVVQAGSFVGAAKKRQLAASVISKHVAKLEAELGVKLLHRTTRRISLTEAGTTFYQYCARIQDELQQSEQALAQLQAAPQGHLRITTMSSVCTTLLSHMIPAFHQRYPGITLEVIASDHVVDLIEGSYDLALRVTNRPGDNLVARKLVPIHFQLCASPQYLEREGRPQELAEISQHRCLTFPNAKPGVWDFWRDGQRVQIPIHSPVSINSVDTLRAMVLQGFGLALLPNYAVAEQLQDRTLECLFPEYRGIAETSLYAVYLPNRYGSPKIRAFVEYCLEYMQRLEMH